MSRRAARLEQLGLDLLVVVAALASAVGAAERAGPHRTVVMRWLEVAAIAVVVLTLLARRRLPFGAPAAVWLCSAALSFVDGNLVADEPAAFLAGMGAALLLGNLREDRQAFAGLAIVVLGAAIIVQNKPVHLVSELAFTPLLFAVSWLAGHALRQRAEQTRVAQDRAAQALWEQEALARLAVAEERTRIARELHDVVAHALSVMVLQTGAVRRRLPDGDTEERDALGNVEEAGRAALAEMRRLLGGLRRDGDELELRPQPGVADLEALVAEVRGTGLDVRLRVTGEPCELPPGVDLSAYRVVQEGLTNTLKHAEARQADVVVRYGTRDLEVTVSDDGRRTAEAPGNVSKGRDGRGAAPAGKPHAALPAGHGLLGIRERVDVFGGEMEARRERNGFVLRARLPYDGCRA